MEAVSRWISERVWNESLSNERDSALLILIERPSERERERKRERGEGVFEIKPHCPLKFAFVSCRMNAFAKN